jgi:hypothetical protein
VAVAIVLAAEEVTAAAVVVSNTFTLAFV